MKRLICMAVCLPLVGCVADSEAVGDLNEGESEDTGRDEAGDPDDGGGSGTAGMSGASASGEEDGSETATMDEGSSGGEEGGSGDELSEDALDPVECVAEDNAGSGPVEFSLSDWPMKKERLVHEDLAGTCIVLELDLGDDVVQTTVECMTETTGPHTIVIGVGAPAAGTVAWETGDEVTLVGYLEGGQGGHVAMQAGGETLGRAPVGGGVAFAHYGVALHDTASGELLVAATNQSLGGLLAPLTIDATESCLVEAGCGTEFFGRMQYRISETDGESVVVTGGRHAELELQDGSTMVFDANRFHLTPNDCHYLSVSIAAVRVNP